MAEETEEAQPGADHPNHDRGRSWIGWVGHRRPALGRTGQRQLGQGQRREGRRKDAGQETCCAGQTPCRATAKGSSGYHPGQGTESLHSYEKQDPADAKQGEGDSVADEEQGHHGPTEGQEQAALSRIADFTPRAWC